MSTPWRIWCGFVRVPWSRVPDSAGNLKRRLIFSLLVLAEAAVEAYVVCRSRSYKEVVQLPLFVEPRRKNENNGTNCLHRCRTSGAGDALERSGGEIPDARFVA